MICVRTTSYRIQMYFFSMEAAAWAIGQLLLLVVLLTDEASYIPRSLLENSKELLGRDNHPSETNSFSNHH